MKEFFMQNWDDILSLLFSAGALIAAAYANHRVNVIHRQDVQEPLYADVKRLLDYKCDYYSSEKKVMDCYIAVPQVSKNEEDKIKRKVHRYFGKDQYDQLCEILNLCTEAQAVNFDMGILFDLIREGEPEKYTKLRKTFEYQENMMSESDQKEIQAFLITVSIPFYQLWEEEPGKTYDYLELSKSLESLSKQILERREKLDDSLRELLMKR